MADSDTEARAPKPADPVDAALAEYEAAAAAQPPAQPSEEKTAAAGESAATADPPPGEKDAAPAEQEAAAEPAEPQRPDVTPEDVARVRAHREAQIRAAHRADLEDAARFVKGDAAHMEDELVRGWIISRMHEDPKVALAIARRGTELEPYVDAMKAMRREFQARFGTPIDHGATEDRLAVRMAIRAQTARPLAESKTELARRVGSMSDAELRRFKEGLTGR